MLFILFGFSDEDGLHGVGVEAGVVHAGGEGHGSGSEVLDLFGVVVHALGFGSECGHIAVGAARMGRDEIGNELLVHAGFAVDAIEELAEVEVVLPGGFAHEF